MIEDRGALCAKAGAIARDGRRQLPRIAGAQRDERLLLRAGDQFRLILAIGGEDVEPRHDIRPVELRGGSEIAAIDRQRLIQRVGREMRREGIGQAQRRGELRAEQARSQNPDRHVGAGARRRANAGLAVVGEQALQLHHVLGKGVGIGLERPPKRAGDALVGTGRAAKAKIDPAGKQRLQRAELLGDLQRRMVGQHDPAGADADRSRCRRDMADHHRRRRAGDPRHAVMFRAPIAAIAKRFGMPREIGGIGERLGNRAAFDDGDEIEQGKGCHAAQHGE